MERSYLEMKKAFNSMKKSLKSLGETFNAMDDYFDEMQDAIEAVEEAFETMEEAFEVIEEEIIDDGTSLSELSKNEVVFSTNSITTDFEIETYHVNSGVAPEILILKNLSPYNVEISVKVFVCDENGEVIKSFVDILSAVQAGASTLLPTGVFLEEYEYDHLRYELNVMKETSFHSIIADISYTYDRHDDEISVHVTNNTQYAGQYVTCYAVFYNNGRIVDCELEFIPKEKDSVILPNQTITTTISPCEEFDSVKCFFTGHGDFLHK